MATAVGRLLFNVLAMVAEFESDLIRLRTREGMKVAKAKGRLCGKQPKLNRCCRSVRRTRATERHGDVEDFFVLRPSPLALRERRRVSRVRCRDTSASPRGGWSTAAWPGCW
ncbi:MAG TPA: recombinase family protein [Nocardioidaceae bacterium]|nr:recombinase family protein [Nocardioidaceae bacterium]